MIKIEIYRRSVILSKANQQVSVVFKCGILELAQEWN